MVACIDSRKQMAASNIKNMMKMNFNLSSQILAKNTNEIVSNCISKIYKQIPNKFYRSLKKTKVADAKVENPGPLRAWKQEEKRKQLQAAKMAPKKPNATFNSKSESDLLQHVMKANRRKSATVMGTNRKLLKSPNYKIYSSRRFGSSATSSNTSHHLRHTDERRHAKRINYAQDLGATKKAYSMFHGLEYKPKVFLHTDATSIVEPARNQNMHRRLKEKPTHFDISSSVQRDLMEINDMMKKRMRISGQKESQNNKEPNMWNHPPSPGLFERRNEQKVSQTKLHQQFRRLQRTTDTKPTGTYSQVDGVVQHNPALCSQTIRKHFTHLNTAAQESPKQKPVLIHDPLSSLKYFASRKSLDISENVFRGVKEGTQNASSFGKLQKLNYNFKPLNASQHYKINGRIASNTIASLANAGSNGTTRRYNRINYLKLSSAPFKYVGPE